MCARACKATRIVEFGSSMGISAIYMAAALRDMGGGRLIGTDLEPGKIERARANVAAAGLADLVEFRLGDARETLNSGLGGEIDMVMLDGAFTLYLPILKLLEPQLKPGALIVGENAFEEASGYIDYVRDPAERLPLAAAAVRSRPRQRTHDQDQMIARREALATGARALNEHSRRPQNLRAVTGTARTQSRGCYCDG